MQLTSKDLKCHHWYIKIPDLLRIEPLSHHMWGDTLTPQPPASQPINISINTEAHFFSCYDFSVLQNEFTHFYDKVWHISWISQVLFAVTRYVSALHRIYTFYSSLGYQESPDNTFVMSKMQFWVFLKDIHMHYGCHTLTDMDRTIGVSKCDHCSLVLSWKK